jgi:uncharacterized protein YcnI
VKSHIPLKAGIAIGAGALMAVALPLSASAHVTVAPTTATAGSYTVINLKVPNESATARTHKVELELPTDTPFVEVSYVPVAGWTTELVHEILSKPVTVGGATITEAVTKVIWTATSAASEIQAGQLQMFPLAVGPVPNTTSIVMPALQTYTDGTVVKWVETTKNAEHPAPVLTVTSATATGTTGAPGSTATVESASDVVARGLGVGGLIIGVIGAVIAIAAMRRATRS